MVQIYLDFVSKTQRIQHPYGKDTQLCSFAYITYVLWALVYVTLFNHKRPMINRILANADRRNARSTPTILNQPMKIKSSGMEKVFEVCGARFQSVLFIVVLLYLWGITFIVRNCLDLYFFYHFQLRWICGIYMYVIYIISKKIAQLLTLIGYLSAIKLDPSI